MSRGLPKAYKLHTNNSGRPKLGRYHVFRIPLVKCLIKKRKS